MATTPHTTTTHSAPEKKDVPLPHMPPKPEGHAAKKHPVPTTDSFSGGTDSG